jgi:hypothetical protein
VVAVDLVVVVDLASSRDTTDQDSRGTTLACQGGPSRIS